MRKTVICTSLALILALATAPTAQAAGCNARCQLLTFCFECAFALFPGIDCVIESCTTCRNTSGCAFLSEEDEEVAQLQEVEKSFSQAEQPPLEESRDELRLVDIQRLQPRI